MMLCELCDVVTFVLQGFICLQSKGLVRLARLLAGRVRST